VNQGVERKAAIALMVNGDQFRRTANLAAECSREQEPTGMRLLPGDIAEQDHP
jgi:hypothetical protein